MLLKSTHIPQTQQERESDTVTVVLLRDYRDLEIHLGQAVMFQINLHHLSAKMTPVTSAPLHLLQLLRDSSVLRDWTLQTLRPQWTSKHTLASTTAPWMMALHLSSLLHFVTTKLHKSNGWCLLHLGINHSLSPDSNKFAAVRLSK